MFSASLGRYLECINEDFPNVVNCHSANLIYLITCNTCQLQYVGECCSMINKRFSTHRAFMKGKEYTSSCKRLGEHFSSSVCKDSEYTVQVLEKMRGNGRMADDEVDCQVTKEA